jgi:hypothetical protein
MPTTSNSGLPSHRERRQHSRYSLHCPVSLTFSVRNSVSELQAMSKNVSLGGLLLEAASTIPRNCPVEFTMIVQGNGLTRTIHLAGDGKVVRTGPSSNHQFEIAVECTHPITEIERYFVGSAD